MTKQEPNGSPTLDEIRAVMAALGRKKSSAKAAAARLNGKRGGRPKNKGTVVPVLLVGKPSEEQLLGNAAGAAVASDRRFG